MLDAIFDLHGPIVPAGVFLLTALEASTLIGIVIPGETAIFAGGVLAWYGRVSLAWVVAAAIVGAIVGDSLGYWIGARWGGRVIHGRLGRMLGEHRWSRARDQLTRKGLLVVFVGRFPPGVRTLVPIAAGTAHMPYGRFVVGNIVGAALWGALSALLGYFAGNAWQRVQRLQHWAGLAMLGIIIVASTLASIRHRRTRHSVARR